MPVSNTVGQVNVGRDITVVLQGDFGIVTIPNAMGFDSKQEVAEIKVDRLDANQIIARLPKGWSGTFEFERGSPSVDNFFAQREAAWYANGTYNAATVFTFIVETDGSTSTYAYDNCGLTLEEAGSWRGDATVKCRISFAANRRRNV